MAKEQEKEETLIQDTYHVGTVYENVLRDDVMVKVDLAITANKRVYEEMETFYFHG